MQRLAALVTVLVVVLAGAAGASAQQGDIQIPIDTVVRGVPDGGVVQLTSVPVAPDMVGQVCTGVANGRNNATSVHPGNDLLVVSGDTSEVLRDVEREPGAVTSISGQLTLGPDITISLRMGPDGTFSGGIDVTLDCSPPPTTTTSTTLPPTTTPRTLPPPTTVPPTTVPPTTVPPTTVPATTVPPTTTTVPPQGSTTVPPTTAPDRTTTTVPPLGSTAAPPDTTAGQLPATGPSAVDGWVVALGAGLLAVGSGAVAWEHRRRRSA